MTSAANFAHWLGELPKQMPTIVQHWDGLPTVTLSQITSGARLLWIFHEDFPEQYGVFVHLTGDEAQKVWETPSDVGLLEGVRRNLRDRDAFVWRKDADSMGAQPCRIPKRGDEPAFAELLWSAAEGIVRMTPLAQLENPNSSTRSVDATAAVTRARTLAMAAA